MLSFVGARRGTGCVLSAVIAANLALVAGCSSRGSGFDGDAGGDRGSPGVVLAGARRVASFDRGLAAGLAPKADGWQREGDGVTSAGYRNARRVPRLEVGGRLPVTAELDWHIGLGQSPRMTMRWRL